MYLIAPDMPVILALLRDAGVAIETSGGQIVEIAQSPPYAITYNAPVIKPKFALRMT